MNIRTIKKIFGISLLGLSIVLGLSSATFSQDDRYNNNNNQGNHYRVKHGRHNYDTDDRGAELLRQAVNQGYAQGFQAGQQDRSGRHRNNWRRNSIYTEGSYGYDSHVDRSQYQYYFQQGFQRGYDDGYNSRNRYGSNNTILGSFLNQILRIQNH